MVSKRGVVVSRKWDSPRIDVWFTQEEVGIHMELDSFINALVAECGNPTMLVTNAQLAARVSAAVLRVVGEMKAATAQIA